MTSLWVEMKCPAHGLERFKIKVIKKYNVDSNLIMPKFRSRPKAGDLSCLVVGRNVSYDDVKDYMMGYFHTTGLWDSVISMRLIR